MRKDSRLPISREIELAELKQSLVQQRLRLQEAESRFRFLSHAMQQPLVVVDADSLRIVDGNPAAVQYFKLKKTRSLEGRLLSELFAAQSRADLRTHLSKARITGRDDEIALRRKDGHETILRPLPFYKEGTCFLLVELKDLDKETDAGPASFTDFFYKLPDGMVVTDEKQCIIAANEAFLQLAGVTSEECTRGQPLGRWLGRPGIDVQALLASVQSHGSAQSFVTVVRGAYSVSEVSVSAAFIGGERLLLGFCMHALTQPSHYETEQATSCPGDRIRKRVGQSSLKQLVQEATDKIERQSIEVALDLTCNNRASAAQLLGLSRQSLYTKLRRYGLYSPSKPAQSQTSPSRPLTVRTPG